MDCCILADLLAACKHGAGQTDITGIAPLCGAVPDFVGENLFILEVYLVFVGADRTWIFLCGSRRYSVFSVCVPDRICTRYPGTPYSSIESNTGRILYRTCFDLDAVTKSFNTDFFYYGISGYLYESAGRIRSSRQETL